jgi:hypothetical protein
MVTYMRQSDVGAEELLAHPGRALRRVQSQVTVAHPALEVLEQTTVVHIQGQAADLSIVRRD